MRAHKMCLARSRAPVPGVINGVFKFRTRDPGSRSPMRSMASGTHLVTSDTRNEASGAVIPNLET